MKNLHTAAAIALGAFDLQLFAKAKVHQLSDVAIDELSIVFKNGPGGVEYAPRNPDARVLGTKGGAVVPDPAAAAKSSEIVTETGTPKKKSSFLDKLISRASKGWLVDDGVPDNIDGDGDGAEDYEQIVSILSGTYYDLQQVMYVSDNEARSMAITTVVDNMLERLDDVRSGGDGARKGGAAKAGARHSKADMETIGKIGEHAKAIGEHVDALSKKDDGTGEDDEVMKAAAKAAAAAFATSQVDPAAVATAAKANVGGIVNSPEVTLPIDANAIVEKAAEKVLGEIRGLFDSVRADVKKSLDEHTVAIDTRIATAAKAGEVATAAVDTLKASVAAMVGDARKASAPGGGDTLEADGTLKKAAIVDRQPSAVAIVPTMEATGKDGAIQTLLRATRT